MYDLFQSDDQLNRLSSSSSLLPPCPGSLGSYRGSKSPLACLSNSKFAANS